MRIAEVSPLFERVPPAQYGGTERIVSYLTETFVEMGHEVTLFASGDSLTSARLIGTYPNALRGDPRNPDAVAQHFMMIEEVFRRSPEFDVIHFHTDFLHLPFLRRQPVRAVTTLHGRLDLPDLVPLYREYTENCVVSISDAQRAPLPWLNWQGTVYHGLPRELYAPSPSRKKYLAFLGRVSPEKGLGAAIEISRLSGIPLKVAAKVDVNDRAYYDTVIAPLLARSPHVEFIGEITDAEKGKFLGEALGLIFPIDWPEPFGLVMIETMACGTPVVAFGRGSVPEIIDEGVTGYVVSGVAAAVAAVENLADFDREACRRTFELRFSRERMARDYLRLFERIIKVSAEPVRIPRGARGRHHPTERPVLRTGELVAG